MFDERRQLLAYVSYLDGIEAAKEGDNAPPQLTVGLQLWWNGLPALQLLQSGNPRHEYI